MEAVVKNHFVKSDLPVFISSQLASVSIFIHVKGYLFIKLFSSFVTCRLLCCLLIPLGSSLITKIQPETVRLRNITSSYGIHEASPTIPGEVKSTKLCPHKVLTCFRKYEHKFGKQALRIQSFARDCRGTWCVHQNEVKQRIITHIEKFHQRTELKLQVITDRVVRHSELCSEAESKGFRNRKKHFLRTYSGDSFCTQANLEPQQETQWHC